MPREIFVFGSNLAGRHGKGSALYAVQNFGAVRGVGEGAMGTCYAIPTKDRVLQPLPLILIEAAIHRFLAYALEHPEDNFRIVAIGCGLAGYAAHQIGPMFHDAPINCKLPPEFLPYWKWRR